MTPPPSPIPTHPAAPGSRVLRVAAPAVPHAHRSTLLIRITVPTAPGSLRGARVIV